MLEDFLADAKQYKIGYDKALRAIMRKFGLPVCILLEFFPPLHTSVFCGSRIESRV